MKSRITISYLTVALILISQSGFSEPSASQKELLKQLPPDQRENIMGQMNKATDIQNSIDTVFEENKILIERPELEGLKEGDEDCSECIYGYSLFKYSPSTFAPSNNIPVPNLYTLGPGDKIKTVLYGNQQLQVEEFISRDGSYNLPLLGPINLSGLTFTQASNLIAQRVASELIGTKVSISWSSLRSITVYILGEAYKPGVYTVSSLSTVTNALFASGGVSKIGSLRNIEIKRSGKSVHSYDFYNLILRGDTSSEFRLEDGDTIFIPFIENKVKIGGAFKRPFLYEFLEGETVEDVIRLAGGFKSGVSKSPRIEVNTIDRNTDKRRVFYLEGLNDLKNIVVNNSDAINVSESTRMAAEVIKVSGEVNYPGSYSIIEGDTILDIINKAGGYTDSSFSEGSVFLREQVVQQQKEAFIRSAESLEKTMVNIISSGTIEEITEFTLLPLTNLISRLKSQKPAGRQVVNLDYLNLKLDPYANFLVRGGDSLFVPRRPDSVAITGEVMNDTTLRYEPGKSLDEYLELAGGLNDQADKNRIFIILPNGQSKLIKRRLFSNNSEILPGSTIVVTRSTRAFDGIGIAQIITPILADLSISAAAISNISNN